MSEGYIGSSEADDDDSESSSAEHSTDHGRQESAAKSLGEMIAGPAKAEKAADEHRTLWERWADKEEKPSLFAAIAGAEQAAAEKSAEADDDDDEAEEKSEEKPKEKKVEESIETRSETTAEDTEEEPLVKLDDDEKKLVVEEYAEERSEALAAERETVEENSPEDAAVAATELYHEKVAEKLENPTTTAEVAVEEAAEETLAEIESSASPEVQPEESIAVSPESSSPEPEAETEEEPTTAAATPPPPPTAPPPTAGGARGVPPFAPTFGTPFGSGGPAPASPNVAPAAPDGPTNFDLLHAERRGQIRGVIAGGIVGYLLGRRRGRIKTEERLLPVQEKLEKEVKQLHEHVADKEIVIRKLAAEKAAAADAVKREAIIEQLRPQPKQVQQSPFIAPPELAAARQTFENVTPTAQVAAAENVLATPQLAEVQQQPIERVKTMSQAELLETSSKVMIDGTALRTIFEARQITESGLRHVLAEYLSGGDIKRALNEELLAKQMTYELDPSVRDQASAGYGGAGGAGGQAAGIAAGQLSSAQGQEFIQSSLQQSAGYAAHHEQSDIPNEVQRKARATEKIIVTVWAILVVALIIIAAVLLAKKQ